jgi:flagellar hook-associated protein 3 FlgL
MQFRVTDSSTSARLVAQIATSQQRIAGAQEQVASGKRINRPSDDPAGAGVVVRVRTDQAKIDQLNRNAGAARETLQAGDAAIDAYELALDRARALLSQGVSDTTSDEARRIIAIEMDSLRERILGLANQRYGDGYLFGGTRQEVAPFDSAGAPAAGAASRQSVQIDPEGALLETGVTAGEVFADGGGNVFNALSDVSTALRGTGDPAADRAALLQGIDRLTALAEQARLARGRIGAGLEKVEYATEQLDQRSLGLEEAAQRVEVADFAEAAVRLLESQRAFEAILQSSAATNRRSLLDLIG